MNKLGIPDEGVNFCSRCYEFHTHRVVVDETDEKYVQVTLTCKECGEVHLLSDPKSTFYEYETQI